MSLAIPATNDGARARLAANLDALWEPVFPREPGLQARVGVHDEARLVLRAGQLARAGSALADVLALPELLQTPSEAPSSAAGLASYPRSSSTWTGPRCLDHRAAQRRAPDGRRGATGIGDARPAAAALA